MGRMSFPRVQRNSILLALVLLAAFALAQSALAESSNWKAEWDRTVAAANKEGELDISGPSGTVWREQLMTFQKTYPKIKLHITAVASRDFWPRIIKEREAKAYLWDFRIGGPDHLSYSAKAQGYLAPVRDLLILPEVVNSDNWYGGLDGIFLDNEKKYFLGFAVYEENIAYYDSAFIKDPAIEDMKNLIDPKWSGKISMADPRAGSPLTGSAVLLRRYGENFIRTLVLQQKPVIVKNPHQQMDWLLGGRYPITIGVPSSIFVEYGRRGVDLKPIKTIRGPMSWTQGVGGIQVLANAPHPNATKVYINWLLTRDVQKRLMAAVRLNSRRKDVPVMDPETAVDYKHIDEYIGGQTESMQPYQRKTSAIYRELIH